MIIVNRKQGKIVNLSCVTSIMINDVDKSIWAYSDYKMFPIYNGEDCKEIFLHISEYILQGKEYFIIE